MSTPNSLRAIPSVDQLLRSGEASELKTRLGSIHLKALARRVVDEMRAELKANSQNSTSKEALRQEALNRLQSLSQQETATFMQRVINATGVVLHTNLGRAPLSAAARNAIAQAAGYCSLEYDIASGSRGKRGGRVEELLVQLTGAEAALVVNNCASAALLILTVLGRDGETIVSRGELVEIGGDFRVPDVMSNSGTMMIEVGSTNRTRIEDYRSALSDQTRVIMRVHPSNYRIVGFTDFPTLKELAELAQEAGVYLYEDAGSGVLSDLSGLGLHDEPIIAESIKAGAHVVSFSGDKLLGATQAGLIVGRSSIIERLRSHSLYRALRADKLALAALEATLEAHRRGALSEIPVLQMLSTSSEDLAGRAGTFIDKLRELDLPNLTASLRPGESAIGGGSGPNVHPTTTLVALHHSSLTSSELESKLRKFSPPIICRIAGDMVLLDLRTVAAEEEATVLEALRSVNLTS